MYINNFKIITKLFLVLFFTTLLNACGGGGGIALDPPPPPPPTEVGDTSLLLVTITGVDGSTALTTYVNIGTESDVTLSINPDAVNRHYSQEYASGSTVNDDDERFLVFEDADDGVLDNNSGRASSYSEIANSKDDDKSPILYQYHLASDGLVATVAVVSDFGDEKLPSGAAVTLQLNSDLSVVITVQLEPTTAGAGGSGSSGTNNNEIRFPSITLNLEGYSYDVWKKSGNFAEYTHFIKANYAAIYFSHYDSYIGITLENDLGGGRHYGVLTKYENIPEGGRASYDLTSLGSYTDYDDHSKDKILFGTGSMSANFFDGDFKLSLSVNDHNGVGFLEITDVQLNLSSNRNQIHTYDCHTDSNEGILCTGEFDYADDSLGDVDFTTGYTGYLNRGDEDLQIEASFYGPNGEEIAGGIYHGTPSANDQLRMAFIGESTPVPPLLGDASPLPDTITGVGGVTLTTYVNIGIEGDAPFFINPDALLLNPDVLNRYYSQSYDISSKVDDANESFLIHLSYDDGGVINGDGDVPSYYDEIFNGSNANESPILYTYELEADSLTATLSFIGKFGEEKLALGAGTTTEIAVTLGSTTSFTIDITNDGNTTKIGTVDISDFSYDVWTYSDVCEFGCDITVADVASYAHFIRAEYAAIYFSHYDSHTTGYSALDFFDEGHYGVLTQYEKIPTTGNVTYDLLAFGSYVDGSNGADGNNDKILNGAGAMSANFSNDDFKLNLNVDDHNGDRFLNISDVQLHLSADRNQINSYDCTSGGSSGAEKCTGSFDYADDSNFDDVDFANGGYDGKISDSYGDFYVRDDRDDREDLRIGASFYGPNGEEIAGGIHHGTPSNVTDVNGDPIEDELSIVFIGKSTPVSLLLGDASLLPESITGVDGSTLLETYPVLSSDSARFINSNAVNRYYSQSYDSNSTVDDANERFLIFANGDDGVLNFGTGRPSYYWEIVNGNSADKSPIFYEYNLASDGLVATVSDVSNFGDEKLASGAAITVKVDVNSTTNITVNVADNEIRFSGITLSVDDYSYDVWKEIDVCSDSCQVSVADVASYSHFLRAEYAAIYFFHYDSSEVRINEDALRGGRHYGVLTKYENIPTTGSVSYNLHSIGSYTDYDDHSNDKILLGTGSMSADFSNDAFELNLNVDDHNGDNFLDINNVRLNLSDNRNQIHSYDCGVGLSITDGFPCTGNFDYADDAVFQDVDFGSGYTGYIGGDEDIQIGASFYGPNGEEIAGGIHHGTPSDGDDLSMAFIGKQ